MSTLKSFDRVAHLYDDTRGVPAEVARTIGAGIASLLPRRDGPPRLLEVGIGTGRIAVPVAAEGVRVAGADISRGMVDVAREKRRDLDLVLAEAAHQPFADASFDAVLFVHVLHLVPDVEGTLAAALRVVRPGGLLLLCETERSQGAILETHLQVRRRIREIAGGESRRNHDAPRRGRAWLEARGVTFEVHELARWTRPWTGRDLLDDLRQRAHSWSWSIPDERMPAILEAAEREISATCGLDRVYETETHFLVAAGRVPA